MNLEPILDYCVGEKIEKDTGVVTGADIRDTHQLFKIVAVGPGTFEGGEFVVPSVVAGDVVWIQKHAAEGDTPAELDKRGFALFKANRIMAKEIV